MQKQKPYKVIQVSGQPVFDSLPVAKITDYPLEKEDYRPFAQCILCLGEDRIFLRMWAFEVSPMPTSALGCLLYLYPGAPETALAFWVEQGPEDTPAASVRLWERGGEKPVGSETLRLAARSLDRHPHNGEDLQGVYWGMTLSLPLQVVESLGGRTTLWPGERFPGNFYKTCEDRRFAHMGSHFPASFPHDPYGPDSMGEFQVTRY